MRALANHWDTDVRSEAIRVLLVKWKIADARWIAVETIASPGEDASARQEAIYGLAAISTRATRTADARICLGVLCSENEPHTVKGAAYDALLIIFRNPAFPTKRRDFDPEKDVDWAWVGAVREQVLGS